MSIFITKIKLYNFRRFREFVIEPNTKNNILIGDNESGKSTILEAIDLVSGGNNRRVEAIGLDNLLNIEAVTEFINSDRCYADLPKLRVELYLIVAFGFAVYIIVKCIATGVTAAANWLASLASKLEAVVIVALITGCVSIVGVLISSIVAKRIEYKRSRQEYLAKKREEPYGQFVDMVYKIQQNTKKGGSYTEAQMLEDLSQFSKQITLWGSSRVVNKWVKFRENGTNPELAQKNLLLLEDIMNEMRKDLGLRKTKKGNLLAFFVNDIKKAIKSMK